MNSPETLQQKLIDMTPQKVWVFLTADSNGCPNNLPTAEHRNQPPFSPWKFDHSLSSNFASRKELLICYTTVQPDLKAIVSTSTTIGLICQQIGVYDFEE